eukprot:476653-Rhodomonas_salina.3
MSRRGSDSGIMLRGRAGKVERRDLRIEQLQHREHRSRHAAETVSGSLSLRLGPGLDHDVPCEIMCKKTMTSSRSCDL